MQKHSKYFSLPGRNQRKYETGFPINFSFAQPIREYTINKKVAERAVVPVGNSATFSSVVRFISGLRRLCRCRSVPKQHSPRRRFPPQRRSQASLWQPCPQSTDNENRRRGELQLGSFSQGFPPCILRFGMEHADSFYSFRIIIVQKWHKCKYTWFCSKSRNRISL